jgi:hypothetical protein
MRWPRQLRQHPRRERLRLQPRLLLRERPRNNRDTAHAGEISGRRSHKRPSLTAYDGMLWHVSLGRLRRTPPVGFILLDRASYGFDFGTLHSGLDGFCAQELVVAIGFEPVLLLRVPMPGSMRIVCEPLGPSLSCRRPCRPLRSLRRLLLRR